jgi:hypothetical protein
MTETKKPGDAELDLDVIEVDVQKNAEAGAQLDLLHPITNAPTGNWLTLLGADSDTYRDAQRKLQRKRLGQMAKQRRIALTPEELDAEALEILVKVTTGWHVISGGQALVFSAEAVRALYKRRVWVREQAEEFISDRANFLPKSASSS